MSYIQITDQNPPTAGNPRKVWSPDLFNTADGTYKIENAGGSPVQYPSPFAYYAGSQVLGVPFVITTAQEALYAADEECPVGSTYLTQEQAFWAAGAFSYLGGNDFTTHGIHHPTDPGPPVVPGYFEYTGTTHYDPLNPTNLSSVTPTQVRIGSTTYDILSWTWASAPNNGPDDETGPFMSYTVTKCNLWIGKIKGQNAE